MPRYFRVKGFSRDTGRKRNRKIEAWDEETAINRTADLGIVVESVEQIPDETASDAQRNFASSIGVRLPHVCTMPLASAIISCHQSGIAPPAFATEQQLYGLIEQKRRDDQLRLAYR